MTALDTINSKMGRVTMKLAAEGTRRPWKMRQENKTPAYDAVAEVMKSS